MDCVGDEEEEEEEEEEDVMNNFHVIVCMNMYTLTGIW